MTKRHPLSWNLIALGASALTVLLLVLWQMGLFNIVDRVVSPDGDIHITVYDGPIRSERFSGVEETPAFYVKERGAVRYNSIRGGAVYRGLWFSPDSTMYVLEYDTVDHGVWQELTDHTSSCVSSLTVYLQDALFTSPLAEHGLPELDGDGRLPAAFQFLQWNDDGTAMQFRYAFTDKGGTDRTGTLWYRHGGQTAGLGGEVFDVAEET